MVHGALERGERRVAPWHLGYDHAINHGLHLGYEPGREHRRRVVHFSGSDRAGPDMAWQAAGAWCILRR